MVERTCERFTDEQYFMSRFSLASRGIGRVVDSGSRYTCRYFDSDINIMKSHWVAYSIGPFDSHSTLDLYSCSYIIALGISIMLDCCLDSVLCCDYDVLVFVSIDYSDTRTWFIH